MKQSAKIHLWYNVGAACMIPSIFSIYVSVISYFSGTTFYGNQYYGIEAVLTTIIALLVIFWWLYLVCAIGVIVTIIRISKLSKQAEITNQNLFNVTDGTAYSKPHK